MKNKTAAEVKAERIRLQTLISQKEKEIKGSVVKVKESLNPISGITSLFNNKEHKSSQTVVDTGLNFVVGKFISKRMGFLPSLLTPVISKSISDQVVKLNVQSYIIGALDWVIEKTEDGEKKKKHSIN